MLSDAKIKAAKPKSDKYKLFDRDGLFLLVQPNGSKLWRMRYQFLGKRRELALGKYPGMSLKDARDKVFEYRAMLDNDVDPHSAHARRRRLEGGYTILEAIDDLLADKARRCVPAHVEKCRSRLYKYVVPRFGHLPLPGLSSDDLQDLVVAIDEAGKNHMALRVLGLVRETYDLAIRKRKADYNPAQPLKGVIKPVKVKNHARITRPARLAELVRAIDVYHGTWQVTLAMKFLSLTFVRQKELRSMTWDDVDVDRKMWVIPAENIKMSRDHIVPLSRQAVEVLMDVRRLGGEKGLVFPGLRPGRPISEGTIVTALRSMGFTQDEMCGHGFRGTASTLLNEMGYDHKHIDMQLAHWDSRSVSSAYNHALYLKQRTELMQAWADYLDELRAGS